jgi:hypothetical protein
MRGRRRRALEFALVATRLLRSSVRSVKEIAHSRARVEAAPKGVSKKSPSAEM